MNTSLWRTLLPHALGDTDLPDSETARAYKVAVADIHVRSLVLACARELRRLVDEGGAEHFLHAAIQGAATLDSTPTEWLKTQLGILRAEVTQVRQERRRATQRRHDEAFARKPLTDAVYNLSVGCANERQALLRELDALRGTTPRKGRIQELRAAGLTDDQIGLLNLPPGQEAEDSRMAALRERLALVDERLAKCRAYSEDPLHDPERVRGLGFDALVEAQVRHSALVAA